MYDRHAQVGGAVLLARPMLAAGAGLPARIWAVSARDRPRPPVGAGAVARRRDHGDARCSQRVKRAGDSHLLAPTRPGYGGADCGGAGHRRAPRGYQSHANALDDVPHGGQNESGNRPMGLFVGGNLMAVAGGAKPSVQMQVIEGQLVKGTLAMRQGVVSDADTAFHRLISGERVFVQAHGGLVSTVERQVMHYLNNGNNGGL